MILEENPAQSIDSDYPTTSRSDLDSRDNQLIDPLRGRRDSMGQRYCRVCRLWRPEGGYDGDRGMCRDCCEKPLIPTVYVEEREEYLAARHTVLSGWSSERRIRTIGSAEWLQAPDGVWRQDGANQTVDNDGLVAWLEAWIASVGDLNRRCEANGGNTRHVLWVFLKEVGNPDLRERLKDVCCQVCLALALLD